MSRRLHYIDWLRVLAVLLLFPFHTWRVFNTNDPFYVKSAHLSPPLGYVIGFIDVWHMPLLFLLAGASSYFALGKRSGGQYVLERLKRLLVPFLFGFFVLIPPQTWFGGRFNSGYTSTFWRYMASGDFLHWNIRDGGDYYGGFGFGHLWFILWLLFISLVALPLLVWGRSERGSAALGRFAQRMARPPWWLLAAFLILLGEALPDPTGIGFFYYLAFFCLGYAVMFDGAFMDSAEKHRWWTLGLGLAISAVWVATGRFRDSLPDPSLPLVAIVLAGELGRWMTLVGLLGVGRRLLDRPSPALTYLAEASYPLYILHQTVIVCAAFFLVRLPVGGALQWLALFAVSVTVTFGLHEVVRRIGPLRFLFGMRPRAKAA